jgi:hypothetical protein
MNPPCVDVAALLDLPSASPLVLGTNLFACSEPPAPDLCVTVLDSGGYAPDSGADYRRPTVQVRVRGTRGDYRGAYVLASSVRDRLHLLHEETVAGSARYAGVWMEGDVNPLGADESERPILTMNFRIHRTPAQ